jgi:hypothetical protein
LLVALVECRRFLVLPEALVARATLEAAGFHPFLFDEFRASVIWTEQLAIGGVRLMVHDQEFESATALLAEIHGEASSATAGSSARNRPWLLLLLLFLSFMVGWPIAGFKMHDRFHRLTALSLTALLISVFLGLWVRGLS